MTYRNAHYSAFYVHEDFISSGLCCVTYDMFGYTMLQDWKKQDPQFPFIDAHDKTYSVLDGSKFEETLAPRLRERLRMAKTFILFTSMHARESKAVRLELMYGLSVLKLPFIMVHLATEETKHLIDDATGFIARELIDEHIKKLPHLKGLMKGVPHCHIPLEKKFVERALRDERFVVQSGTPAGEYSVACDPSSKQDRLLAFKEFMQQLGWY